MSYFFSFYIDHVTPRCLVIGKRADKKFQERRYWFLAAPFSDPIRLRFCPLESFAIALTAHSHTHIPFDTCIFIPPPRFHGEISGLERATPSNCALWKRRVFEKYRWKNSIPVFRNLREVFNIKFLLWFSTMIFIFTFPENEDSTSFYLVLVVSWNEFYRSVEEKRIRYEIYERCTKFGDNDASDNLYLTGFLSHFQILEFIGPDFSSNIIFVYIFQLWGFLIRVWKIKQSPRIDLLNYFPVILISTRIETVKEL